MTEPTCPKCGSDDVEVEDGILCNTCKVHTPAKQSAEHLLSLAGISRYASVKDGGEDPIRECPNCGMESFVDLRGTGSDSICAGCGETVGDHEIEPCTSCGTLMYKRELLICSDCRDNKIDSW